MSAHRTTVQVALAALAVSIVGLQACHVRAHDGSDVRPAGRPPASSPPATRPAASPAPPADDGRLQAALVLRLFCRFVDSGRLARAGSLLAPHAWPRRELRAFAVFRFISARVYAAPDSRTLVMLTRIRVHTRAPSPLPDGVATLFFTLGRVGTTGSWLITAAHSSP
jgi:hypothetical protein